MKTSKVFLISAMAISTLFLTSCHMYHDTGSAYKSPGYSSIYNNIEDAELIHAQQQYWELERSIENQNYAYEKAKARQAKENKALLK